MVIRVEVMESNDCEGLARLKLKALQNIMQSITVNGELGLCNWINLENVIRIYVNETYSAYI